MGGIHHRLIARMLPAVPEPILWRFSKRYIAGPELEDAARTVRDLNEQGCLATLDVLGEYVSDPLETRRNVDLYLAALDRIREGALDANISLKLSAMGQTLEQALCLENARRVVAGARDRGNWVRFDMEDATTTDSTLEIYRTLLQEGFTNIGVCLQSRLRRTLDDIRDLADLTPNYRLCKGIYLEPEEVAFTRRSEIDRNYVAALNAMLRAGSYVGIATHDPAIIGEAERIVEELNLSSDAYEFQMLLGVAEGLRDRLVSAGHRVRIYVPYGRQWRAYSLRRLQENPEIVGHIMSNLFRG